VPCRLAGGAPPRGLSLRSGGPREQFHAHDSEGQQTPGDRFVDGTRACRVVARHQALAGHTGTIGQLLFLLPMSAFETE
jgi:hypothetical protein